MDTIILAHRETIKLTAQIEKGSHAPPEAHPQPGEWRDLCAGGRRRTAAGPPCRPPGPGAVAKRAGPVRPRHEPRDRPRRYGRWPDRRDHQPPADVESLVRRAPPSVLLFGRGGREGGLSLLPA